jgi:hypothetical protein
MAMLIAEALRNSPELTADTLKNRRLPITRLAKKPFPGRPLKSTVNISLRFREPLRLSTGSSRYGMDPPHGDNGAAVGHYFKARQLTFNSQTYTVSY